jgi:hypothetical protein
MDFRLGYVEKHRIPKFAPKRLKTIYRIAETVKNIYYIYFTFMEVNFWGVKSSGCENSHATEVKCSYTPQKS